MVSANGNTGITQTLAKFYANLDYESLSPETIDRAKYFCLDYLGMALRGSIMDSSIVMQRAINRISPNGDSITMGTSLRASPEYAALANGCAAHSIEMDDVANIASLHPAVPTFPTAFACADITRVTGRQFISSITSGYDIMVRLGRTLNPQKHYARGFHPTSTCGTFGAAVVSSNLLGLDAQKTLWALGIAGSQAAGSQEYLSEGAWTKRFHPGWASHSGIVASLLAREGFVGPLSILEGKYGFFHAYTDGADPSIAIEDLGEIFYINRTSIKPYACCRYKQGPIDCLLKVMQENRLDPKDISRVTIAILKAGYNTVASPVEKKRNPQNVVEAQFSMHFGAAVAILYGKVSLDEYTDEVIGRQEIKDMMQKVDCVEDPALELNYPAQWPAWVEIQTNNGLSFKADITYPKGDPENALTWDELKEKFKGLVQPIISPSRANEIIGMVDSLEDLENVRELAELTSV